MVSGVCAKKFGNANTAFYFIIISTVSSAISIFTSSFPSMWMITILSAKFGISGVFNICFLIIPEYFPPVYRSSVFGIANVFGRTLAVSSSLMAEVPAPTPMISFCVLCFLNLGVRYMLKAKNTNLLTDNWKVMSVLSQSKLNF